MSAVAARLRRAPLRVAFVIDTLVPGAGTENQLLLLLSRFDRSRIVPVVFCLWDNPALRELNLSCDVRVVGVRKLIAPTAMRGLLRLRRWIGEQRCGAVVTFFRNGNMIGTVAGYLAGAKVISSRRNIGYWSTPADLRILGALNRLTDAYIANSDAARRHTTLTERVPQARIAVIPNAIDTELFRPAIEADRSEASYLELGLPRSYPLIGCLANLRPVKGHNVLLEAFRHVLDELPQSRLVLIGEGECRAALESHARNLGLGDRVLFLGSRSDVPRLLRVLDLGVLSSRSESLSNSIVEYLASGLSVVVTDVGGSSELVAGGRHGLLVPPDDPLRMAGAILELCRDPLRRAELGRLARRFVERNLAVDVVLERWHGLLEEFAA